MISDLDLIAKQHVDYSVNKKVRSKLKVSEKENKLIPSKSNIDFNKGNVTTKKKFLKISEHVKISVIILSWKQLRKIKKESLKIIQIKIVTISANMQVKTKQ